MFGRRAVGLAAGWLADLAFADPPQHHPVAGFGAAAGALERRTYRDVRWAGVVHAGLLLSAVGLLGVAVERVAGRIGIAAATWTALGGTSLLRTVAAMTDTLSAGDVGAARRLLPSLCGRDPAALDADGLTRAALESLAENTSDAQVAPLLWTAVGGAPGALVYRAVNTLDAMVGYRSPRYARFGWAAARLDDFANFIPARFTAALVVMCAPLVGDSRRVRSGRGAATRNGIRVPTPGWSRRRSQARSGFASADLPAIRMDSRFVRLLVMGRRRGSMICAARSGCHGQYRRQPRSWQSPASASPVTPVPPDLNGYLSKSDSACDIAREDTGCDILFACPRRLQVL